MRSLRIFGLFLCVLALASLAAATGENLGIRDTYRITLVAPVHVGQNVLPAGDYKIRRTMLGQDHLVVFQKVGGKSPEVKVPPGQSKVLTSGVRKEKRKKIRRFTC